MPYKLLKKYPGLPNDWEVGMTVDLGDNKNTLSPTNSKYTDFKIDAQIPRENEDFWEYVNGIEDKLLEYRMYFLTMYNISPIQQGIQSLHAAIEYANKYHSNPDYYAWSCFDKTVIILNGGTSGLMIQHASTLGSMEINHTIFHEPDLNNSLSAIAFLVDERVFDKIKYPDKREDEGNYSYWNRIGGEKNADLREFLKNFRLA